MPLVPRVARNGTQVTLGGTYWDQSLRDAVAARLGIEVPGPVQSVPLDPSPTPGF